MLKYKIIGQRNPVFEFFNEQNPSLILYRIQVIGDCHLGRKFLNGVPKNRLNHREQIVFSKFEGILNQKDYIDLYVIVGDLFDKTVISNECLNRTIDIIKNSVLRNKNSHYFIINGNHDEVKDKNRISSFSLLKRYFTESIKLPNLNIINEYTAPIRVSKIDSLLYFSHYDPFTSNDKIDPRLVEPLKTSKESLRIIFGHFDIEDFDGNTKYNSTLISEFQYENFNLIITGHIHKPSQFTLNNTHVVVSGSLQPFAFGEEIKEDDGLYQTMTISRCNDLLSQNIDIFKDSNVRLLYKKEEIFPSGFDCLSRTYKLIEDSSSVTASTLDIDLKNIVSFKDMILSSLNTYKVNDPAFVEVLEEAFLNKNYE